MTRMAYIIVPAIIVVAWALWGPWGPSNWSTGPYVGPGAIGAMGAIAAFEDARAARSDLMAPAAGTSNHFEHTCSWPHHSKDTHKV